MNSTLIFLVTFLFAIVITVLVCRQPRRRETLAQQRERHGLPTVSPEQRVENLTTILNETHTSAKKKKKSFKDYTVSGETRNTSHDDTTWLLQQQIQQQLLNQAVNSTPEPSTVHHTPSHDPAPTHTPSHDSTPSHDHGSSYGGDSYGGHSSGHDFGGSYGGGDFGGGHHS